MKTKDEEVVEEAVVTKDSDAKKQFKALIERYKASNPVKYAAKKAELDRKLAAIQ